MTWKKDKDAELLHSSKWLLIAVALCTAGLVAWALYAGGAGEREKKRREQRIREENRELFRDR